MPNPIKIVLLTDCLADLAGGAEKQIYELARRLDKTRFNVIVVSLDTYGQAPRELIESAGCRLVVFRVVRVYGLSGLVQGLKFFNFLKDEKIDIVQTYHFSSDMWGTFWGKLAGVRFIFSNRRDMGFWRKGIHVTAYKLMNRWVRKIIVVSDSIKAMVTAEEGVEPNRIDVIYNGVELSAVSPLNGPGLRESVGAGSSDVVIAHVANLKPVKGHTYLLQAVAGVVREFPNVKVALIGQDDLKGALQAQAKELGISDKIFFLGKVADAQSLLAGADICVLPSLSEGMSNSILEYMAAGKPVVATSVGGNPELVQDGYNGLLVLKENAGELKDALLTLMKDEAKRKVMGQNGLKRVRESFSMDAMVGKYDRLFTDSMISGKVKLLHLVSSGGLFGAERVILGLAGQNNGIMSFVGALNNRHNPHLEVIEEARRSGFHTAVFDSGGQFDPGTILRIRGFLKENDIDIIHTHNYKSDIMGFLAACLAGKKWVATNHVWHTTDKKLAAYERVDAMVLKFASKIVAVSDEIKRDLLTKDFKSEQVKVIHNGINVEQFAGSSAGEGLRKELGIGDGEIVVSIVGRLAPEKRHDVFLKAARLTIDRKKPARFLVVGDGPLSEELKAQAQTLGVSDKVIFTGIREDIPRIYAITDILVNASTIEGLPMTILEAMAAGVAIIATKVGAVPDVIHNEKNGILIAPGDPESLAREICDLIDRPDKRKNLSGQAYQDVRANFSVATMAGQYREVYREVLYGIS